MSNISVDVDSERADQRRRVAAALAGSPSVAADRAATAPDVLVAVLSAGELARACALLERPPSAGRATVAVNGGLRSGQWYVDVAAMDRPGVLRAIAGSLAAASIDIDTAAMGTWPDGVALGAFSVRATRSPDANALATAITSALVRPVASVALRDARVRFTAGPGTTTCELTADDRPGVLHAITSAFASVGADIGLARILTVNGRVADRFTLRSNGGAISSAQEKAIQAAVKAGVKA